MKLRFYDIVSQLIPGLMVYFSFMYLWDVPQQWQKFLPAFAFAMALGFGINAISSWLQPIYYWTWGGKPSTQLLNGIDIPKGRFYQKEQVAKWLEENYPGYSTDALFEVAYQKAKNAANENVRIFNDNYAYARSLVTTGLILAVLFLSQYYCIWWVWLVTIFVLLMLWQRARE